MQAVLLAAGESSRMYPLSKGQNKSMIKLLGKPLLEHTIEGLKRKDVKDLIIVVSKDSNVRTYFGDGKKFGVSINYVTQENPEGMGNGLILAEEYIQGDFLLLNSYHLEVNKFIDLLMSAKTVSIDSVLIAKKRKDVSSYGVVEEIDGKVIEIIEKPKKNEAKSNLGIVGMYLFSKNFLKTLSSTTPEHYQLESALDKFVKSNDVALVKTDEKTIVLKHPWNLLDIKNYLLDGIESQKGKNVSIANNVNIDGEVFIGDNVKILEGATIKGPTYIGNGAYIGSNVVLRDNVIVEEGVVIGANMEVKNSILMNNSSTHSGFIGDSIIGDNVKIGATFTSGNARLDRKEIEVDVKGKKISSGKSHLGVIIGNNTSVGINSTTMPGIIIGTNVVIGPSTTVMHNVLDNKKYYTKFSEIISK